MNTTTKEDLLYYTLFSFEQLKLSAESIEVTVFGTIEKEDEYFNLLYEYIRNVKLGERPHQFTFPAEFNTLAQHKYFGLFTQDTMRIISGTHKGRRLMAPSSLPVRPTTDRAKEALIQHT